MASGHDTSIRTLGNTPKLKVDHLQPCIVPPTVMPQASILCQHCVSLNPQSTPQATHACVCVGREIFTLTVCCRQVCTAVCHSCSLHSAGAACPTQCYRTHCAKTHMAWLTGCTLASTSVVCATERSWSAASSQQALLVLPLRLSLALALLLVLLVLVLLVLLPAAL